MRSHLVTGATGFVGGALVLELLARTDARVTCLVRGDDSERCRERLHVSLRRAARGYGVALTDAVLHERVLAVRGDILQPRCGAHDLVGGVDEVWHSAASLKYENAFRHEIVAHNVGGTEHALDLAEALGASCFNYISTAYVSGSRCGEIAEADLPASTESNNWYERSKLIAEHRVLARGRGGMRVRILRPSIVIGHSRTLEATSFTGFYGFIRNFVSFRDKVNRRLGNILAFRPVNLRANPESTLNFIPVDVVARDAVRISTSDSQETFFHLTHPSPPQVAESFAALCSRLGVRQPRFLRERTSFTSLDQRLDSTLNFYSSYLDHPKAFERSHTLACGAGRPTAGPRDAESLLPHIDWYLERLAGSEPSQTELVA